MTTCLGKSCSFGLPCMSFMNIYQFYVHFSFGFEGRMWDVIVLILDHCLSIYFSYRKIKENVVRRNLKK